MLDQFCNKPMELFDYTIDNDIDLLSITENWLSNSDKDHPTIAALTPPGYKLQLLASYTNRESRCLKSAA